MENKIKSKIDQLTDSELQILLDTYSTYSDIIFAIGYKSNSGYLVKQLGLRCSTLDKTKFKNQNRHHIVGAVIRKDEDLFLEHGNYSDRGVLKSRILKEREYKCQVCGIDSWQGRELSLQLDHINGINTDNRRENLRLICPNCHSQTDSFSGKAHKKTYYCSCGNVKTKLAIKCDYCSRHSKRISKIDWPTNEVLNKRLWETPTDIIAKELGISGSAISKYCRINGINKPPRGYWQKIKVDNSN